MPTTDFSSNTALPEQAVLACSGPQFKQMITAGYYWLERHREVVNQLNVFPVPDGDTGTNMWHTMRSAVHQVDIVSSEKADAIAKAMANGALMGARGNSGVILSQFLQGIAQGLTNLDSFTVPQFSAALRVGADTAYQSVSEPVEGTILTVAREAALAAQSSAEQTDDLRQLLQDVLTQAKVAQAHTPELLPILKEAGVTDSGGQGLVYFLEGMLRQLDGEPIEAGSTEAVAAPVTPMAFDDDDNDEGYGYDVQFLIHGEQLDLPAVRAKINDLGWSALVVGSESLLKVHVHVHDPGIPLSYGVSLGPISDIVVENMSMQAEEFYGADSPATSPSKPATSLATLAVVPSAELGDIFREMGTRQLVFGGQTMNPSTADLLTAVEQAQAETVLLLPNNSNIILTAQQSQQLSEHQIVVVPTKTVPQGVAALMAFNASLPVEDNVREMTAAIQQVITIEITQAVRDTTLHGKTVHSGQVIGLADNRLVSVGDDCAAVTLDTLAQTIDMEEHEVLTIYRGQDLPQAQAEQLVEQLGAQFDDLEIDLLHGGQPHYYYIISLE